MSPTLILRHLAGFAAGGLMFAIAIPCALAGLAAAFPFAGGIPIPHAVCLAVGISLLGAGVALVLWTNVVMVHVGQGGPADAFGVAISPRTRRLLVAGPYRWSRNPMVLGAITAYFGLSVLLNAPAALVAVLALAAVVPFYLRRFEEPRLLADFGAPYEAYRHQVPLLVPRPWSRRERTK
jgi:protein-S-isoprenylcysteine O-methyltransferase Ste14